MLNHIPNLIIQNYALVGKKKRLFNLLDSLSINVTLFLLGAVAQPNLQTSPTLKAQYPTLTETPTRTTTMVTTESIPVPSFQTSSIVKAKESAMVTGEPTKTKIIPPNSMVTTVSKTAQSRNAFARSPTKTVTRSASYSTQSTTLSSLVTLSPKFDFPYNVSKTKTFEFETTEINITAWMNG